MTHVPRTMILRSIAAAATILIAVALSACGTSRKPSAAARTTSSTAAALAPGSGRPPVTIGDKNFTEQFVLGELYAQALSSRGYNVTVNRNIGPTEVTLQALYSGRLSMYTEYLGTWNSSVAGFQQPVSSMHAAFRAGLQYARAHGLELLSPTPFSDTGAIAVTNAYSVENGLRTIGDLRKVAAAMTIGAAPQLAQSATGLPALEQAYGFVPASFTPLEIGGQYEALDNGTVQAAAVNTTDGQLDSERYTLLRDPRHAFGWGQVVPVVPEKVLAAEGPTFAATIDQVSALLTTRAMRQLNADVDIYNQDPATVAKQFLQAHGLLAPALG